MPSYFDGAKAPKLTKITKIEVPLWKYDVITKYFTLRMILNFVFIPLGYQKLQAIIFTSVLH